MILSRIFLTFYGPLPKRRKVVQGSLRNQSFNHILRSTIVRKFLKRIMRRWNSTWAYSRPIFRRFGKYAIGSKKNTRQLRRTFKEFPDFNYSKARVYLMLS